MLFPDAGLSTRKQNMGEVILQYCHHCVQHHITKIQM